MVEGRDDTNSIKRAVEAETIETHGFGIRRETWQLLERAYKTKGLIVFTDPDHAGEEIRRRVLEKFPDSKEAFLTQGAALKDGDIGVENASPEDIRAALSKARTKVVAAEMAGGHATASKLAGEKPAKIIDAEETSLALTDEESEGASAKKEEEKAGHSDGKANGRAFEQVPLFTAEDMNIACLTGVAEAAERRRQLGDRLGIGYGNAKSFLRKLNSYGITREEWETALRALDK